MWGLFDLEVYMDSEFVSKVLTCALTGLVTLAVCLINNYFQTKRDEQARTEAHKKQLQEIQKDYSEQIGEMKTDVGTKFQELQTAFQTLLSENKHQYRMVEMEIKLLSEKQSKYNNLQERVALAEKNIAVQSESFNAVNDRIKRIEEKND